MHLLCTPPAQTWCRSEHVHPAPPRDPLWAPTECQGWAGVPASTTSEASSYRGSEPALGGRNHTGTQSSDETQNGAGRPATGHGREGGSLQRPSSGGSGPAQQAGLGAQLWGGGEGLGSDSGEQGVHLGSGKRPQSVQDTFRGAAGMPGAAVTKDPRAGGLNNRSLVLGSTHLKSVSLG